jgi:subtilisin-like proprotein convertase family protein
MRSILYFVAGLILLVQVSEKAQAQMPVAYSPVIDSLIGLVTESTVSLRVRQLSGDTTVLVGGETKTITTRNYQYNSVQDIAAQFVLEKFQEYGYQARYQDYSATGRNVLGWKTGTKYPDKKYIICAHYDNMPTAAIAPGADDNASGVVAVMEAARLLAGLSSEYTIEFAIWDEEEIGLVGSAAYADSASINGEQIMGVLNYDMIAWDSNNDFKLTLGTNTLSQGLTTEYQDVMSIYTPEFTWDYTNIEASDHASFWYHNYPAILAIEEYPGDFNAYYHTPQDHFNILNLTFFTRMVQAAVAGLATEGWNCKMSLQHQPVLSGVGTGDQTVILNAVSPRTIANNENKPRLYYSINGGNYQFLYPDDITGSSYKFYIPGQPFGTTVNYYFAVQDQNGLIIETLPRGGRGINPPGSVAPVSQYTYLVAPDYTQTLCSNTVPKAIPDLSTIYDTIPVSYVGGIKDINVNVNIDHTRVSTLNLSLIGPDGTTIDLSSDNGGSGSNFTNTTFDDEAMISIKNGIAPYTGSFKPEQPLSTYDVKEVTGNWILKVQDDAVSQVGTLQNWCITINYFDLSVGIAETSIEKAIMLDQNFPNPVFGITNIPFTLPAPGKADIDLYDLYGRKVMSIASGTFASGLNVINVDLSGLSSGTYFYRLVQGDITQTKVLLLNR